MNWFQSWKTRCSLLFALLEPVFGNGATATVVTSITCFQGCLFQRHFNAWTLTSGSSQHRDAEAKNGMIQPLLCSFQVHCRHSGSKPGNDALFKYYTASFVKEQTEEQRELHHEQLKNKFLALLTAETDCLQLKV